MILPRRALLLLPLLLAACGGRPPPVFEKLDFSYLTKIKLDVANIDIDDSWAPRGSARQVGTLAPTKPMEALRRMATDRLVPGGNSGRANFVIDNASLIQDRRLYVGDFTVHLDIFGPDEAPTAPPPPPPAPALVPVDPDDTTAPPVTVIPAAPVIAPPAAAPIGTAVAHVHGTQPVTDDEDDTAIRIDLDALVRRMMDQMNVEFEFQLRKTLREKLQTTSPTAPAPDAVDTQDLEAPVKRKP